MFILLIAMAVDLNAASDRSAVRHVQVMQSLQARGRIISGQEISARRWKPRLHLNQREILKVEKDGRTVLLRVTEFE